MVKNNVIQSSTGSSPVPAKHDTVNAPAVHKPAEKNSIFLRSWLKIAIGVALLVLLALYLVRNVLLGTPTKRR